MKAVVITKPGGPEVLEMKDRPLPVVNTGEVLVKVEACGVNRPDLAQRKGHYPPPPGASIDIPGLEIAGTVMQAGTGAARWPLGAKVCALVSGGGYAEYCAVPEGQCLPIPGSFSFAEAASLPEAFFTVWHNVFERGALKAGESLLIHGGSSGIGTAAIQIAKKWGCTVYVTAGTAEKCSYCEKLGADKAINYKSGKFREAILDLTNKTGVNVILDMIGGDYTSDNLEILSYDGRLVLINFMRGEEATIKLGRILNRRLTMTGSTLRARDSQFKAAIARQLEKNVWPWLDSKAITPVVYKTFPLANADKAHQLLESGTTMGKLVLVTGQVGLTG